MPEPKKQSLKITIPAATLGVLLTAFGGTAGYQALFPSGSMAALEELRSQMTAFETKLNDHCLREERRDDQRDLRTDSQEKAVALLGISVARIEANTDNLQRQMTEACADIKKLLQGRNPTPP